MRELKSFEGYPCECGKITVTVKDGAETEIFKEYGSGTKSFGVKGPGVYFFGGNLNEKLFIGATQKIQIKSMQDNHQITVEPSVPGAEVIDPVEEVFAQNREYSNSEIMSEIKELKEMMAFLINNG